jgi:hypothetical protein
VLLLPVIFEAINEKTLYIFGGVNIACIFIVYALYPESNQRTLEEMDLLFACDSIWTWDAEKEFARLKAENPELVSAARAGHEVVDPETGLVGAKSQSHAAAAAAAAGGRTKTSDSTEESDRAAVSHRS